MTAIPIPQHHAGEQMTATPINIENYVIMRQPPQPKRLGELLKLACTLIGDLPAPRQVTVSAKGQTISVAFDGTADGLAAMSAWSARYNCPLTGELSTLTDGTPVVWCELSIERTDGVTVEGWTYVPADSTALAS
jgi:hypothetical protein